MALSGSTCDIAPVVLQGAAVALFICSQEVPVDKIDLKKHAKKTEVTSTASYQNGVIWEEYSPGVSGGTVSWDGHWRVTQAVKPTDVFPGHIYAIKAYVRRPLANGSTDPGSFYSFNAFIDDSSLTLDPKGGTITWKVSATITGPIVEPT